MSQYEKETMTVIREDGQRAVINVEDFDENTMTPAEGEEAPSSEENEVDFTDTETTKKDLAAYALQLELDLSGNPNKDTIANAVGNSLLIEMEDEDVDTEGMNLDALIEAAIEAEVLAELGV